MDALKQYSVAISGRPVPIIFICLHYILVSRCESNDSLLVVPEKTQLVFGLPHESYVFIVILERLDVILIQIVSSLF